MVETEMTMKFDKTQFAYHGGYLTYGPDRRFVARFKHRGPVTKAKFVTALVKHYDTEAYFARLKDRAPLQILMDDGFLVFDLVARKAILDGKVC
jgi:hypothetical protein